MTNIVRLYWKDRRNNRSVHKISDYGYSLYNRVDKMRKAKFFKPAQHEIEYIIDDTKLYILYLVAYFDIHSVSDRLLQDLLEELSNMEIHTLVDCKEAASLIYLIGERYKKGKHIKFWSNPLLFNLTPVELIAIGIPVFCLLYFIP